MLSRRLTRRGYSVFVATDGCAGIAKAHELIPDIILMDLNLPVTDGWSATKKLKQHDKTKSIPVIAVSSHALPGERETALDAGCDEYETKPIDFESLIFKIKALLPHADKTQSNAS